MDLMDLSEVTECETCHGLILKSRKAAHEEWHERLRESVKRAGSPFTAAFGPVAEI